MWLSIFDEIPTKLTDGTEIGANKVPTNSLCKPDKMFELQEINSGNVNRRKRASVYAGSVASRIALSFALRIAPSVISSNSFVTANSALSSSSFQTANSVPSSNTISSFSPTLCQREPLGSVPTFDPLPSFG